MATILIVDDNAPFRVTLRTALERSGHSVVEAENGQVAVQRVAENSVDAVVTDILMPSFDGIELIRHLRRDNIGLPILAMSGGVRTGSYDALDPALKLGATAAIAKPFRIAEFVALVGQLLAGKGDEIRDRG
ncbi:MAG: response regulator [Alphaproteobacteria bacterium]|nr:response regulator [Alphaproteobacteria bacterium]